MTAATIVNETEQKKAIETQVTPLIKEAQAIVVKNAEQRAEAVSFVERIKVLKVNIEERFKPTANRERAHEQWKALKATENAFYEPLDKAVDMARLTVNEYDREVAKKAQREADMAEAKRREDERKEKERLQKLADEAAKKGKTEKAEALQQQAENVSIAPTFEPAPTNTKKLVWKARVLNPLLACKSISEGLIPFNAVDFKQSALNDLGKGYDGKSKIPGIEFYQDVNGRI